MAETIATLAAKLTLNAKEFNDGLGKAEKDASQFSASVSGVGKVAGIAFGAAATAVAAFGAATYKALAASDEQERVQKQLAISLKNTGQYSDETYNSLLSQASALQSLTTIGDEAAIQMQALAVSMGVPAKEAGNLVNVAADMASALGISLDQAVKQLSATLGGNIGQLGRIIPSLKDMTEEQLKAGGAVEYARKQFAGFAANEAQTFTGGLTQINNLLGDQWEKMGDAIKQTGAFTSGWPVLKSEAMSAIDSIGSDLAETMANGVQVGAEFFLFMRSNWLDLRATANKAIEGIKFWKQNDALEKSDEWAKALIERLKQLEAAGQKGGAVWNAVSQQLREANAKVGDQAAELNDTQKALQSIEDERVAAQERILGIMTDITTEADGQAEATAKVADNIKRAADAYGDIASQPWAGDFGPQIQDTELWNRGGDVEQQGPQIDPDILAQRQDEAAANDAMVSEGEAAANDAMVSVGIVAGAQIIGDGIAMGLDQSQLAKDLTAAQAATIQSVAGISTTILSSVNPLLGQIAGSVAGPLLTAMVAAPDQIGVYISNMVGNLVNLFNELAANIDEAIMGIVENLDEILLSIIEGFPKMAFAMAVELPINLAKSLPKAIAEALADLLKELFKVGKKLFGKDGTFDFGIFRAEGGPVSAGQGYIVGEQGPEWFQPNQSGSIVPADQTAAMGGSFNVTINLSGGATQSDADRVANAIIKLQKQNRWQNLAAR